MVFLLKGMSNEELDSYGKTNGPYQIQVRKGASFFHFAPFFLSDCIAERLRDKKTKEG